MSSGSKTPRRQANVRRLAIALGLVFAAIGVAYGLASHWHRFAPLPDLKAANLRENAIWLSRHWMRPDPQTRIPDEILAARLNAFHERGIRYLFPHVCPMDEKGHLPRIDEESTKRLLAAAAKHDGFFQIMPWVGGSIDTVDLSSRSQRDTWTSEVRTLVEKFDFPGVNVNIEPLEHADRRIMDWLSGLREALGTTRTLSFCGIRPETRPRSGDNLGIWTEDDYALVSKHADQIAVMSYDSGRKLPVLFTRWSSAQFVSVVSAVQRASSGRCRLLWGIPTYEDRADYFSPEAENVRTAFHALARGLRCAEPNSAFQGVCIYADWTTDDSEWDVYDRVWK